MPSRRNILGISAYYHDAASALLCDGRITAAAQEERFTRKKNDSDFPRHAISACLRQAGLTARQLDAVVFYDKPILKFARVLETYLAVAPHGWRTFPAVMSNWLGEKLDLRGAIRQELPQLRDDCAILFTEHHQAHAASAFYPSPFAEAGILTVDGVGEWATTTIGVGRGSEIRMIEEVRFPHSLGLLYSAFTDYCGFRINSGEYKLMGLAPYGEPKYADAIRANLVDQKADGSFRLNMDYFDFLGGTTMTNSRFHHLFGGPSRGEEEPIEQRHMDAARSIQLVCEEMMLRLARRARDVTGCDQLCLAGGVALNCVANGRILREKIFERLWIQPAAGDAGGALGAALAAWHSQEETSPQRNEGENLTPSPVARQEPRPTEAIVAGRRSCGASPTEAIVVGRGSCGASPTEAIVVGRGSCGASPTEAIVVGRGSCRAGPSEADLRPGHDSMQGALLGPEYSESEIEAALKAHQAVYSRCSDDSLLETTAKLLANEKVAGWFQGRMEFGPRALGNRSILGDARSPRMQSVMNLKVKFRESFRPFAPVVRRERVADYFELDVDSPYMLLVAPVQAALRQPLPAGSRGFDLLKAGRSTIPAVTHVDYSARVQTVTREINPRLYDLLLRFEQTTGCGVLINTSFNVRGEPIVCTPDDAYRCFMNTEMDYLIIGNFVIERLAQPRSAVERRLAPQAD